MNLLFYMYFDFYQEKMYIAEKWVDALEVEFPPASCRCRFYACGSLINFFCHVLILHCFYYFLKLFLNLIRIFFFFFFFFLPFHSFICTLGATEAARVRKALTLISQLHCSHLHFCSVFVSSLAGLELGKRVIFSFILFVVFPFSFTLGENS